MNVLIVSRDSKSTMESSLGPQMERSILLPGLDLHTIILLWLLDSGCDVKASLKIQQQRQLIGETNNSRVNNQLFDNTL